MTAGAATLAFGVESSFKTLSGTPNWTAFGRDERVTELSLSNQLQRFRDAGQVEFSESVAQNFEGAFAVTAVISNDTHGTVESDIVFNGAGQFTDGNSNALNSVQVAAGIDFLNGTAERLMRGCIPLSYEIAYQQGEPVEYTLTMAYAEEDKNTGSVTPSSITQATTGSTAAFHGTTLTLDGGVPEKLQSATLSVENIGRFQRGASRVPLDATPAGPEATLTTEAIYDDGETYLDYALGGSAATSVQDSVDALTGTNTLELQTAGGTTISTYTMDRLKPRDYEWSNLVAVGDMTEPVTFDVNGGLSV